MLLYLYLDYWGGVVKNVKNIKINHKNLSNMIDMGNQCCYNKNANTVRNTER